MFHLSKLNQIKFSEKKEVIPENNAEINSAKKNANSLQMLSNTMNQELLNTENSTILPCNNDKDSDCKLNQNENQDLVEEDKVCLFLCLNLFLNLLTAFQGQNNSDTNHEIQPRRCTNCLITTTTAWRRNGEGHLLCNACGIYWRTNKVSVFISEVQFTF